MRFLRVAWSIATLQGRAEVLGVLVSFYLICLAAGQLLTFGAMFAAPDRKTVLAIEIAAGLPPAPAIQLSSVISDISPDAMLRLRLLEDGSLRGELVHATVPGDQPWISIDPIVMVEAARRAVRKGTVEKDAVTFLRQYKYSHLDTVMKTSVTEPWQEGYTLVMDGETIERNDPVPAPAEIDIEATVIDALIRPNAQAILSVMLTLRAISSGLAIAVLMATVIRLMRSRGHLEALLVTDADTRHLMAGLAMLFAAGVFPATLILSLAAGVFLHTGLDVIFTTFVRPTAILSIAFLLCLPVLLCTTVKPRKLRWRIVGGLLFSAFTAGVLSLPVILVHLAAVIAPVTAFLCLFGQNPVCGLPDAVGWIPVAGLIGWIGGLPSEPQATVFSSISGLALCCGIYLACGRVFNRIDLCVQD